MKNNMIEKFHNIMSEEYGEYNINNILDFFIEILEDNPFTCDDVIQNLIYRLERLMDGKETKVLNTIHEYCANDCGWYNQCSEEDCVLYRIEQIITEESEN